MEIKTFWKIILKLMGLYLVINCIYVIPQFASTFSFSEGILDLNSLLEIWIISILSLILYVVITRVFLFKTDWVIAKLKLDQSFTEQRIDLNFPAKRVLAICIILFGAITFAEGLPVLCHDLFQFFQQKELLKNYPETSWLVAHFLKTLFGFLIMTNSKFIVGIIDKEDSKD